jgi:hypothetical protein
MERFQWFKYTHEETVIFLNQVCKYLDQITDIPRSKIQDLITSIQTWKRICIQNENDWQPIFWNEIMEQYSGFFPCTDFLTREESCQIYNHLIQSMQNENL